MVVSSSSGVSALQVIRGFIFVEGASFILASLIHFGVLANGYQHQKAGTAESVIGIVLLSGLVLTLVLPRLTRVLALTVQGFALLGTCVGLFTIAIGVGPRTVPDLTYHATIVIILMLGLILTWRSSPQLSH